MAQEVENHSEFIKTKPEMGRVVNEDSTLTKFQEDIAAARPRDRNLPIPFPEPSPRPPKPFREEDLSPLNPLKIDSIESLFHQKDEKNSASEQRHVKPRIADEKQSGTEIEIEKSPNPGETKLDSKDRARDESPMTAGKEAVRGALRGAEFGAEIGQEKNGQSPKDKIQRESEHIKSAIERGTSRAAKEFLKFKF